MSSSTTAKPTIISEGSRQPVTEMARRPSSRWALALSLLVAVIMVGSVGSSLFSGGSTLTPAPAPLALHPSSPGTAPLTRPSGVSDHSTPATSSVPSSAASPKGPAETTVAGSHAPASTGSHNLTQYDRSRYTSGSSPQAAHQAPGLSVPTHSPTRPVGPAVAGAGGASSAIPEDGTEEATIGNDTSICSSDTEQDAYVPSMQEVAIINTCSENVVFYSASTEAVISEVPIECPTALTYDPATEYVFVIDGCADSLDAIDPVDAQVVQNYSTDGPCPETVAATGSSNATLVVSDDCDGELFFISSLNGAELGSAAADVCGNANLVWSAANGEVDLAESCDGNVTVYSVAGMALENTIMTYDCPNAGVADPGNGTLYVTSTCGAPLILINSADNAYQNVTQPSLGTCPQGIDYSTISGDMYITDQCSNSVEVYDPSDGVVLADPSTGTYPETPVASQSSPGDVFIPNSGSDFISVLQPVDSSVVAEIPDPDTCPSPATFDPVVDMVYVATACVSPVEVTVVDPNTNSIVQTIAMPSLSCVSAIAYDPVDDAVWVACGNDGALVEIDDTSNSVVNTVTLPATCDNSLAYDAPNDTLFIGTNCGADGIYALNTSTMVVSSFLSAGCVGTSLTADPVANVVYYTDCNGNLYATDIGDGYTVTLTSFLLECPLALALDPQDGLVFALQACADTVGVVSTTGSGNLPGVPLSETCPGSILYDPLNDLVFIGDECSGLVQAVSGSQSTVISTVNVATWSPGYPIIDGLALDTLDGTLYASDDGYPAAIFAIDATNDTVSDISVGSDFCETTNVALDTDNGLLYAPDPCVGELFIIDATTHAVVAEIELTCPNWAVYDPVTQDLYVSDYCENYIWVIDPQLESPVGELATDGDPMYEIALDASQGLIYGIDDETGAVDVISIGEAESVAVSNDLCGEGIVYDPATGLAYVTDPCTSEVFGVSSSGTVEATLTADGNMDCPLGIALDTVNGQLIVDDPCDGEVLTLGPFNVNDYSYTYDESCPIEPTFDPANGLIYNSDGCKAEIDAIDPVAYAIAAEFPIDTCLFCDPDFAGVYDPATGEVFIGTEEPVIGVISTELGVGAPSASPGTWTEGTPFTVDIGCSFGSSVVVGGVYYLASNCAASLSAYDLSDGQLVGTAYVPGGTYGFYDDLAYDPTNGLLYAANPETDSLDVFAPAGPSYVTSIYLGPSCPTGLAVDGSGNIWVTDDCYDDVNVVSGSSNEVLGDLTTGDPSQTAVYAPAYGAILVIDEDGEIDFFDASTFTSFGSGTLPLATSCAMTSAYVPGGDGTLYVEDCNGQLQAVDVAYGSLIGSTIAPSCGEGQIAGDPSSLDLMVVDPCNGDVYEAAPGLSGLTPVYYGCPFGPAIDPDSDTWWFSDACYGQLVPISYVDVADAPGSEIDVGGSLQVSAQLWGPGAFPDTTIVSVSPSSGLACGPSTAGPTLDRAISSICTGELPGTYTVWLNTTDVDGNVVSSWIIVQVYPALSLGAPSANVNSADSGQSVTFTSSLLGGSGSDVAFSWSLSGVNTVCTNLALDTVTCTMGSVVIPTTLTVQVEGFDSTGAGTGWSPALLFTVDPDPIVSSIAVVTPTSSAGTSADVGQVVTFGDAVTSSTSVTYDWMGLPAGCAGPLTATVGCLLSAPGTSDVTLGITDANGFSVMSAALTFVVDPAVNVTTPSPYLGSGDVGETVTFTSGAGGGSGAYVYAWSGLPASCPIVTTSSVTCTLAAGDVGTDLFTVTATDGNGESTTSPAVTFVVYDTPTVSAPTAGSSSGDVGQTATFDDVISGGSGLWAAFFWQGLPADCALAQSVPVSCVLTTPGTYTITLQVFDLNGGISSISAPLVYTVYADPAAATPTASTTSVDVGESGSVVFTASGSGGSMTYTGYTWFGLPSGCTGQGTATVTCPDSAFTTPGAYSVSVSVSDSNGMTSATSPAVVLVVDPALSVPAPVANHTATDVGQGVTFSVAPTGGSGTYTYAWSGLPASGCTGTDTATVVCLLSTAGPLTVSVTVTDGNGVTIDSTSVGVTVNSAVGVSSPVATVGDTNATSADTGQSVTLTASASGGSGSYVDFTWTGLPASSCVGTDGPIVVCTFPSAQTYTIGVSVTDSLGGTASSASTLTLAVVAAPTVTASPQATPGALDLGQTLALAATVSGGASPWTYAWQGLPAGCASTDPGFSCTPTAAGIFVISFVATDGNGDTVTSSPVIVEVNPLPTLTAAASTLSAPVGSTIAFVASSSGGTGTLTYTWDFDDSTGGSGGAVSHTFGTAGTYVVTVTAKDAAGATVKASVTVTVTNAAAPAPQVLGLSNSGADVVLAALGVAVLALLVAVVGLLLLRRKGSAAAPSKSSSPPTEASKPAASPPPAEPEAKK